MPDLPISLILKSLPTEMVQEAVRIAVEQMKLTPEKLALILVRHFNPDQIIEQGKESTLRGVKNDTLKTYKDEGHFPRFINGQTPSQR